jgi:predicted amidohydrolase YtcJ
MPADVVFRVGRAYGMTADRGVYQAVAVSGGRIAAAERSRDDLDSLIGPGTAVIDDPELVLYPAFADTHNHQLLAATTRPLTMTQTAAPSLPRSAKLAWKASRSGSNRGSQWPSTAAGMSTFSLKRG